MLALLLTAALFSGCSNTPEEPEVLIPEDTYTSLLVELQLARTYAETGQVDSLAADSLRNRIFKKYEVTSTAFRKSHNYYQHFPKQQKKRVEEAIEKLRMDRVIADSTNAKLDSTR
ncbi:MAG TPA: DUF4296 domain-containing protein [Fodinibius sp.]|nr:DUF4296 domain-containing protein [Fodinibius sp.]